MPKKTKETKANVKKKVKKAPHRPIKPIDWELLDLLLEAQCSGVEIASRFRMHPETLYDRVKLEKGLPFSDYMQSRKDHGKSNARLRQYKSMMQGNTQIALHWAAHNLGQSHKAEIKQEIVQELNTRILSTPILELPDNGHRFAPEPTTKS